jgi:hypothetical protein
MQVGGKNYRKEVGTTMFRQVKLVRRSGEHIATVVIEAPASAPDIVIWNGQYFVRHGRHPVLRDEDVYREGMCVNVIPIPGVARNDGTEVFPLGPVRYEQQESETAPQTKCNRSCGAKSQQRPVQVGV